MSSKVCDLSFHNYEKGVIHAGQTVTGNVIVTLEKSQKIQELILKIFGYAECRWTDGSNDDSTTYTAKETYFETQTNLIQKQTDTAKLTAGVHRLPFSFILPRSAPSSFRGNHGKVKYKAQIVLKRPFKFDSTSEFVLNVLAVVDLNTLPSVQLPVKNAFSKNFNFLLMNKGSLDVKFEIPVSGYVSGQILPIKYCLRNDSKVEIATVKIKLVKTIVYHSSFPSKRKNKEIIKVAKWVGPGVEKQANKTYETHLDIPELLPTSYTCSIIVFSYELKVSIVVTGMHTNFDFDIPIVIGTVPLNNTDETSRISATSQRFAPPSYIDQMKE
ncbi:arrestin domain-containing protein 17-like [Arctopsyche grandis]|uniref:arrestin domain-containing protein 17-like n=1 Tax=Arctopsyche grandis TaxID=121162 RepID=UPI00406D74F4